MIDDVALLLREAGVPGPVVGPDALDRLAACVVEDGLRDELVSAVLETCDGVWADGGPLGSDELGPQIGDWRLDLDQPAVRRALLTAVLAGALVQQGRTSMVVGVVAALLPALLDVESGAAPAAEAGVVPRLRLRPDVATGALSADALHRRLPLALREVVNELEFADLVQRLREEDGR